MLLMMTVALAASVPQSRVDPSYQRQLRDELEWQKAFADKRLPRVADIERAERVLARFRCISSMQRWVRRYSLARNANTLLLDPTLIEFNFTTAGYRGKRAGRQIVPFAALIEVDDGDFDTAKGVYSIATNKATLTYCGPNHPPLPKPGR